MPGSTPTLPPTHWCLSSSSFHHISFISISAIRVGCEMAGRRCAAKPGAACAAACFNFRMTHPTTHSHQATRHCLYIQHSNGLHIKSLPKSPLLMPSSWKPIAIFYRLNNHNMWWCYLRTIFFMLIVRQLRSWNVRSPTWLILYALGLCKQYFDKRHDATFKLKPERHHEAHTPTEKDAP